MDYRTYKLNWKEEAKIVGLVLLLTSVISVLFYNNFFGFILSPIIWIYMRKKYKTNKIAANQNIIGRQFLDMAKSISAALLAGYSIENAWTEAQSEMQSLHGEDAYICKELQKMNQAIALNEPVERLMEEFALRTGVEDIIAFSEVFSFAKRSGGDFVGIIQSTIYRMQMKKETEAEIEVLVSAKKLESRVMNFVPIFILAYLRITSGDYLDAMYHNLFGFIFMTVCLVAYFIAFLIAEKILNIVFK